MKPLDRITNRGMSRMLKKVTFYALLIPALFAGCLNMTDGYTGSYLLPEPAQSATTGNLSGAVGVPPSPANPVSAPCQVNDGTNYRGYWNGLEMDTCATTNFKARLQERIRNPHRVVYYTTTSQFPKPVGFSNLPTGFSNPPTNETTQKSLSVSYLQDMTQWVVPQWNVWHTFTAVALMGVNPGNTQNSYNASPACATDSVFDYYGGNCMTPPGQSTYPRLFNTDSNLKNSEGSQSSCNAACQAVTYNREHSWPKSWFAAGTSPVNNSSAGSYCYNGNSDSSYDSGKNWDYRAFTDLHHLRPTSQKVNTIRSNWAYGIVNGGTTYSAEPTSTFTSAANPSTGGKSGTPSYANISAQAALVTGVGSVCASISNVVCSNNSLENCVPSTATTVFEPPDHIKGNMARNYFYMATRYYTEDTCWATSDGTNKAHIKLWLQCLLLRWHQQDPPDAKEVAYNDLVHRIQGNRNPFVDHPEWVAAVINNGGF